MAIANPYDILLQFSYYFLYFSQTHNFGTKAQNFITTHITFASLNLRPIPDVPNILYKKSQNHI